MTYDEMAEHVFVAHGFDLLWGMLQPADIGYHRYQHENGMANHEHDSLEVE